MTGRHVAALVGSGLLVFGLVTAGVIIALRVNPLHQTTLTGVVLVDGSDAQKQMPIPDVRVTGQMGNSTATTNSDQTGYFRLNIPSVLRLGRSIELTFEGAGYEPLTMTSNTNNRLFIARLQPRRRESAKLSPVPRHTISNVHIRYTVPLENLVEVGPAVKTFVVANQANLPCKATPSCSPDGKWKATDGGVVIDAGERNHFRNVRASCIAGSCPFTRIDEDLKNDSQILHVSVLNWGDTATFLVEADVVHSQISDMVKDSFPVQFGDGFTFTLPPGAEGPSIEAELDKVEIVFPLGPELLLSWATCTSVRNRDHSVLYSCELKPDYRFL